MSSLYDCKHRVIDYPFTDDPNDIPIPYQEDFNAVQVLSEMPAVAIRTWAGHWCGYVGLSLYETEDSMDNYKLFPTVHGGITFTSHCPLRDSCVGLPNANLWWIGFDCGHYGDMSPNVSLAQTLTTLSQRLSLLSTI